MQLSIEVEQEEDGCWLSEVPELPGVLADRIEHGGLPQMRYCEALR